MYLALDYLSFGLQMVALYVVESLNFFYLNKILYCMLLKKKVVLKILNRIKKRLKNKPVEKCNYDNIPKGLFHSFGVFTPEA